VSATEQLVQRTITPHAAQMTLGAKPRRFKNKMVCSRASSACSMARWSGSDSSRWPEGPGPMRLRSTSSTLGSTAVEWARSGSSSRVSFPCRQSISLSSDGVADPSTATAPARWARRMPMSRAW
jgi:hypothetical protein